ncbi:MAG: hypothetical protein ACO4AI_01850 [Prochlorothrix sp.]|jgi:hypothetical protein
MAEPQTWDDGVWIAKQIGNLTLFHNPKCRVAYLSPAGSPALDMLHRGLPPSYVVQHACLNG